MTTLPPPPEEPSGDDPFRKPPPEPQQPSGSGGDPYGATPPPPGPGGAGDPYGTPPPPPPGPGAGQPGAGQPGAGNPYGSAPPPGGPGGAPPPPYDPNAYGGAYGGADPLAGMPPLAEPGRRLLARIIDIVIVAAVVFLISLIFGGFRYDYDADDMNVGRNLLQSLVAAVLYVGYDTVMTSRNGQTVGKRVMGLRTAMLDNGANPPMQASLLRAVVLWLPAVFCCACIWTAVCGGWSIFDKPYRQGLHEKAAKTVVVKAT
ncbi:RDD family protein [Streptomyces sp. NPDC060194]|uniref:RDD family protein n=1 Tax=Streptomyces sp. NPDC060194 TaxID=3347069 RepID=UPI0036481C2C